MKVTLFLITGFVLASLLTTVVYADDLIVLGNGHAPFYISNHDEGRFDFSNDLKADYHVKAHYIGNSHQQLKIDYKLQDLCVEEGSWDVENPGGDTFDDALLKFALSNNVQSDPQRIWLTEDITLWNPWFKSKKHDDNKMIDLSTFPTWKQRPFPGDGNGDDAIQSLGKSGSFKHSNSINELDDQSGWEGSIFLTAPPGNYILWTIHPSGGQDGCDRLGGLGIPIIITE